MASEGVADICAAAGLETMSLAVYVLSAWCHSRQAGMKSPRGLRLCHLHLRRRAALRGDRGLPLRGDRFLGEVGEGETLAEDMR
ncbi:MAG: hypothetical protein OXH85_12835 [Truepera sp.]|nr:hypothetical protein [Truepera sp.]